MKLESLESMIKDYERRTGEVSVPIRGLFNLTWSKCNCNW